MNIADLKPAGSLAVKFGVKALLYGAPGAGKTPLINTAPNALLLVSEPGMLSMRGSTIPAFEAYDVSRIKEFFTWFFNSAEAKKFDTLAIDSFSQIAEAILTAQLKSNSHGLKAYGEMSREVMDIATKLYYMQNKHVILICKQTTEDEGGTKKRKPFFPGQDLNVKMPHLFDGIFHMGLANVPGVALPTKAIRTAESFDVLARDRSGRLSEFEQPNLTQIFNKVMA